MLRFLQYYGRFEGFRGNLKRMPPWARGLVAIFAIPGAVLIGLSILALLVSILALLLLTVPIYRLLSAVLMPRRISDSLENPPEAEFTPGPRRHVDVKIIE